MSVFLFMWAPRAKIPTLPDQTSGHVWAHGTIREGVRRLPFWWVWFSASMFVAAWIYLMLYPGYGHHVGLLGWTSHGELARDQASNNRKLDGLLGFCESTQCRRQALLGWFGEVHSGNCGN